MIRVWHFCMWIWLTGHACGFVLFLMLCRGCQYPAIAEEIRDIASKDPAHRKLFVRGLAWETTSEALRDVSAWMAWMHVIYIVWIWTDFWWSRWLHIVCFVLIFGGEDECLFDLPTSDWICVYVRKVLVDPKHGWYIEIDKWIHERFRKGQALCYGYYFRFS